MLRKIIAYPMAAMGAYVGAAGLELLDSETFLPTTGNIFIGLGLMFVSMMLCHRRFKCLNCGGKNIAFNLWQAPGSKSLKCIWCKSKHQIKWV